MHSKKDGDDRKSSFLMIRKGWEHDFDTDAWAHAPEPCEVSFVDALVVEIKRGGQ
jgi:hypothetical protein